MNHHKKISASIMATLLGSTLFFNGCGYSHDPRTLKVGAAKFAENLEPTDNYYAWTVVRDGIGETLARFDAHMNPQPWLAKSWSVSSDGLTWTIDIKDNIYFSNGQALTAQAVKDSLERVFEKNRRAKTYFTYDSIQAEGQTLKIHTSKALASLPGILADPLFVIIDTSDPNRANTYQGPIGTGPYMVKSFTPDATILQANPHYWDGPVPYENVEIYSVDDASVRAMAVESGEIDLALNISPDDMDLFEGNQAFNISEIVSLRDVLASINMNPGRPLSDKRVRQALIKALNRQVYNENLLQGRFLTGKAPLPPSLDYGFDTLVDPNTYNPQEAKALLAQAGYVDTDGDGIVEKDGQPLQLHLVYYTTRAELRTYAEATQADARKVGIDVVLENVDYNVLDSMRQTGNYDLLMMNIITANTGNPEQFMKQFWWSNQNGQNPINGSGYYNPEYDRLTEELSNTLNPAKRRNLIIQMEQILLDDGASIFYGYPKTNMVYTNAVTGLVYTPSDYYWITNQVQENQKRR